MLLLVAVLLALVAASSPQQVHQPKAARNQASNGVGGAHLQMLGRWCCLNQAEFDKCSEWRREHNAATAAGTTSSDVLLECVLASDKFDCFKQIFEDKADLMSADAGEVYTAGKYYNLMPISTELYSDTASLSLSSSSTNPGGSATSAAHNEYYAVAVVKRGSGMTIGTLKGSNSCHGGVGTSSGWNMPISTLIEKQLLEIVDCNNHVKAAAKFFNKMCAPDALNTQFNPTGDNPTSACDLCGGRVGSNLCTNQDPYAGAIGAMYCLIDGGGDVAFVKHTTLSELAALNASVNANDFELLCPNVYGSPYNTPGLSAAAIYPYPTAPLGDYKLCNWGVVPGRAVITSSRKALVQRRAYRRFLGESVALFSGTAGLYYQPATTVPYNSYANDDVYATQAPPIDAYRPPVFYLFDSSRFGGRDLIFLDQAIAFQDIDDKTTYLSFLPEVYRNKILKLYECPLRLVRWCVISNFEKDKCRLMKNAFASRNIKPDLDCVSGDSAWDCMSMINNRLADLITLDPADAYRANRYLPIFFHF